MLFVINEIELINLIGPASAERDTIINSFIIDYQDSIQALKKAVEQDDLPAIRFNSHKVKQILQYMCFDQLYPKFKDIEITYSIDNKENTLLLIEECEIKIKLSLGKLLLNHV